MTEGEMISLQELQYAIDNFETFDFGDFNYDSIKEVLELYKKLEKENNILKNHIKYKSCTICGKEYETKRSDSKYCKECAKEVNRRWLASASEEYKDKRREKINKVTKEDVIKLASKIHLDTIYLLEGEDNEEE